jgi:hypothetical protein
MPKPRHYQDCAFYTLLWDITKDNCPATIFKEWDYIGLTSKAFTYDNFSDWLISQRFGKKSLIKSILLSIPDLYNTKRCLERNRQECIDIIQEFCGGKWDSYCKWLIKKGVDTTDEPSPQKIFKRAYIF